MSEILEPGNMKLILKENNINQLSDEAIEYVKSYVPLQLLTNNFWDNFILGAAMYGISVGYTGAL